MMLNNAASTSYITESITVVNKSNKCSIRKELSHLLEGVKVYEIFILLRSKPKKRKNGTHGKLILNKKKVILRQNTNKSNVFNPSDDAINSRSQHRIAHSGNY